ncbi:hypothetical protein B0T10DRAFT_191086 [Thelonectria olida]|uniref:Uncharacterized protein n=1 Tax=Thelonectria olida TaxID=1576542 RepID=A0A9P9AGY8_9HYPO|nr:hypothetical protein B0T10DRAFT_191086 [Thelonectria olida]
MPKSTVLKRLSLEVRPLTIDLLEYGVEKELSRFNECQPKLAKYVVDGVAFMQLARQGNMNIVVKGANVGILSNLLLFNKNHQESNNRADGLMLHFLCLWNAD